MQIDIQWLKGIKLGLLNSDISLLEILFPQNFLTNFLPTHASMSFRFKFKLARNPCIRTDALYFDIVQDSGLHKKFANIFLSAMTHDLFIYLIFIS